ncbi:CTD small phosphatase-like protein 3 [Solanum tuberosum]|uniref:CTD small phosphatase-like protein 3 n=1 Tax=Solanum tuberosum TaxID=4113 RepID=UPI00073A1DE8|nr:PREDICTED: CTD small phosphatase-like protein 3 [Solanum tuberosum]
MCLETLVHSTLEHIDDAYFTFPVSFNMKEHIVYMKQRPHLKTFLERVADMFEIVIFTASQSIYVFRLQVNNGITMIKNWFDDPIRLCTNVFCKRCFPCSSCFSL